MFMFVSLRIYRCMVTLNYYFLVISLNKVNWVFFLEKIKIFALNRNEFLVVFFEILEMLAVTCTQKKLSFEFESESELLETYTHSKYSNSIPHSEWVFSDISSVSMCQVTHYGFKWLDARNFMRWSPYYPNYASCLFFQQIWNFDLITGSRKIRRWKKSRSSDHIVTFFSESLIKII